MKGRVSDLTYKVRSLNSGTTKMGSTDLITDRVLYTSHLVTTHLRKTVEFL